MATKVARAQLRFVRGGSADTGPDACLGASDAPGRRFPASDSRNLRNFGPIRDDGVLGDVAGSPLAICQRGPSALWIARLAGKDPAGWASHKVILRRP
jgi:hypothetical protein